MNTLNKVLARPNVAINKAVSPKQNNANNVGEVKSFQDFMQERIRQTEGSPQLQTEGIKFSAHATSRLESRGIKLNEDDLNRINVAVDKAKQKGSKDSLVMLNDLAMIVNIKNKTVVTAVNNGTARDNIFTNIDSAVMA